MRRLKPVLRQCASAPVPPHPPRTGAGFACLRQSAPVLTTGADWRNWRSPCPAKARQRVHKVCTKSTLCTLCKTIEKNDMNPNLKIRTLEAPRPLPGDILKPGTLTAFSGGGTTPAMLALDMTAGEL